MKNTENDMKKLHALEQCLKHTFADTNLLRLAMTHSSYAHEYLEDTNFHNERLEFLGDAVLELVTSKMLYAAFQTPEGDLSRKRAAIVCEPSLAYVAKELQLGRYLYVSRGEEKNGGRRRNSLLADFFEALIGAIYLDAGYDEAESFIYRELFSRLKEIDRVAEKDYKTMVQEIVQAKGSAAPEYVLVETSGPPHDRVFTMQAFFQGQCMGTGKGRSKKEAEQHAAHRVYEQLTAAEQETETGRQPWS